MDRSIETNLEQNVSDLIFSLSHAEANSQLEKDILTDFLRSLIERSRKEREEEIKQSLENQPNVDRTISRNSIWFEILRERLFQDEKWGGEFHDDQHTEQEWISFIKKHSVRADLDGYDFREQMIKVAALAFAAIESHDRIIYLMGKVQENAWRHEA